MSGVASSSSSVAASSVKVRWNQQDDIILLRQITADHPYRAGYGKVMTAWHALANKLVKGAREHCTEFRPLHVDGKAVQARFKKLLSDHKRFNASSMRASGTAEEETEKTMLLDDVLADYVEFEEEMLHQKSEKSKEVDGKEVNVYYSSLNVKVNMGLNRKLGQCVGLSLFQGCGNP